MNKAAQELGRLGGLAKSKAKTKAARENAKLGGRPKSKKKRKQGEPKYAGMRLVYKNIEKAAKRAKRRAAKPRRKSPAQLVWEHKHLRARKASEPSVADSVESGLNAHTSPINPKS